LDRLKGRPKEKDCNDRNLWQDKQVGNRGMREGNAFQVIVFSEPDPEWVRYDRED
jgi:hypothetical protein